MDLIAAPLRDLVRKARWMSVSNNTLGEGESDSRISKVESELANAAADGDSEYSVKFASDKNNGYCIVVINKLNTRMWSTSLSSDEIQWIIRKELSHLDIDSSTISLLISSVVSSGGVDASGQMTFAPTDSYLHISTRCNLTLPACDSCLPVLWKMSLKEVKGGDFATLMAELVINPMLAVCSGMSYSHSLFQSTILQKDRELKHYRDTFGSHTVAGKRPSPALAPDSYYSELLKSEELRKKLSEGRLSSSGTDGDFNRMLYSAYMSLGDLGSVEGAPLNNDLVLFDSPPPSPATSQKRPHPSTPDQQPERNDKQQRTSTDGPGSYIETEEERGRREKLTQKISSPKKTQQQEKKVLKKKLKNVFK